MASRCERGARRARCWALGWLLAAAGGNAWAQPEPAPAAPPPPVVEPPAPPATTAPATTAPPDAAPALAPTPAAPPSSRPGPVADWPGAYAPDRTPAEPVELPLDPAVPAGSVLLGLGVAAMVPGLIGFVLGDEDEKTCSGTDWYRYCDTHEDFTAKQTGLGFFTAGATAALLGAAALSFSGDSSPFPAHNGAMAGSGLVLTGLGAATIVGGTASWIMLIDHDAKGDQMVGGGVLAPIGVVMLALGVPLWIAGSAAPEPKEGETAMPARPWRPDELVLRSPPMVAGGAVLLTAATAGLVSTGVLAADAISGDDELGSLFGTIYAGIASAIFAGVGVTLVAYGAAEVTPDEASAKAEPKPASPALRVGPGTALVVGEF